MDSLIIKCDIQYYQSLVDIIKKINGYYTKFNCIIVNYDNIINAICKEDVLSKINYLYDIIGAHVLPSAENYIINLVV